jgi:hypothetical protein
VVEAGSLEIAVEVGGGPSIVGGILGHLRIDLLPLPSRQPIGDGLAGQLGRRPLGLLSRLSKQQVEPLR